MTTEHATRRPLRRIESSGHHGSLPALPDAPAAGRAYDTDHPDQLETLCVGEAR